MADQCCEYDDCDRRICPENTIRKRFKEWTLEAVRLLQEDRNSLYGWQRMLLKMLLKAAWPRVQVPSWSKELKQALEEE